MSSIDSAFTDIPQSEDPQVRAVFVAMNGSPARFWPETTCAEMVQWARALIEAGVIAATDAVTDDGDGPDRLYVSTITESLTPQYRALRKPHPGAVPYIPERIAQAKEPG